MDENKFPDIFNETETPSPNRPIKKTFSRSRYNVIIAGVCSGIAKSTNTEPALIRVLAMLTLLFGGWSVAAYLIIAVLTPIDRYEIELTNEEKLRLRKINYKTILGGSMILAGIYFGFHSIGYFSSGRLFVLPNSLIIPVIFIVLGSLLISNKYNNHSYGNGLKRSFYRSRKDRRLLGVCGGIAEYTNTDSTTIRAIFVIGTLLTLGAFAAAYFVLALFIKFEAAINDTN